MVITSTRLIRALSFGSGSLLGLAIFPFVIIRGDIRDSSFRKRVILHERIHIRQQLELLVLPFYIWYLAEYCTGRLRGKNHYWAIIGISFEKEADAHMEDADYLRKRKLFAFLRYFMKSKT